jgi:peptidoglycan-associated lipoprotein
MKKQSKTNNKITDINTKSIIDTSVDFYQQKNIDKTRLFWAKINNLTLISSLIAVSLVTGCSKSARKSYGSGSESAYGSTGTGGEFGESDLAATDAARYGDGSIPMAEEGGPLRDIYFDYDSANLSPESRADIEQNSEFLKQNQSVSVQLEGHTDDRGTDEYNLALGEYRARSIREALIGIGISPDRLKTVSYGENIPVDTSGTDLGYAKNRRVHFAITSGNAVNMPESTGAIQPEGINGTSNDGSIQQQDAPVASYDPYAIP